MDADADAGAVMGHPPASLRPLTRLSLPVALVALITVAAPSDSSPAPRRHWLLQSSAFVTHSAEYYQDNVRELVDLTDEVGAACKSTKADSPPDWFRVERDAVLNENLATAVQANAHEIADAADIVYEDARTLRRHYFPTVTAFSRFERDRNHIRDAADDLAKAVESLREANRVIEKQHTCDQTDMFVQRWGKGHDRAEMALFKALSSWEALRSVVKNE